MMSETLGLQLLLDVASMESMSESGACLLYNGQVNTEVATMGYFIASASHVWVSPSKMQSQPDF
jgi:hypothetical protein